MYIVQSLGSRIHVQDPRSYSKIMCRSLIIVKRGAGLEMNDALVEPSGDSLTSAGLSFVAKILIILIWGLPHIHWFVTKIGLLPRFSLLLFSSISCLIINFSLLFYSHLSPDLHLSHGNILQDKEGPWCRVGPGHFSRSCSGLSHCLMFCCCLQFVCCCFIEFLNYRLRHLPVQDALNKLYLYYMLPVL